MKEESMNNETTEKMNPESAPALDPGGLPQVPHQFLSKEELALRLKRTVRTVEVWQKRGILPYVKCENTVLFNWPEVVAHLQKNFRVCRQRSFGNPIRLPVYQMAEEKRSKRKSCRAAQPPNDYENQNHSKT
jgi:hypothetical protein